MYSGLSVNGEKRRFPQLEEPKRSSTLLIILFMAKSHFGYPKLQKHPIPKRVKKLAENHHDLMIHDGSIIFPVELAILKPSPISDPGRLRKTDPELGEPLGDYGGHFPRCDSCRVNLRDESAGKPDMLMAKSMINP